MIEEYNNQIYRFFDKTSPRDLILIYKNKMELKLALL